MKKIILIALIGLALTGCEDGTVSSSDGLDKEGISTFTYNASEEVLVTITEFRNSFNQECIMANTHNSSLSENGKASVSCIKAGNYNVTQSKTEVKKQFVYNQNNTPIQVTDIKTANKNLCTIVHSNYNVQGSEISINCSF